MDNFSLVEREKRTSNKGIRFRVQEAGNTRGSSSSSYSSTINVVLSLNNERQYPGHWKLFDGPNNEDRSR